MASKRFAAHFAISWHVFQLRSNLVRLDLRFAYTIQYLDSGSELHQVKQYV